MLSSAHFYHRVTRKMVVAFGTLFNNIRLVRYNKAGTTEIERIIVPLQYAQKEKFYQRITQDPELTKEVQMTLPRMSFELDTITYDPLRKRSLFVESYSPESDSTVKSIRTTPYNFDFSLNIYVRNTEDGTQIIEQILPYFNPDYTLTVDVIGLADQKVDIPFILNNVNYSVEDVGSADPIRVLVWTLSFTAKGYMYGPIVSRNIIRKVTANTFNTLIDSDERTITVANTAGSGTFKLGELVYQGSQLSAANATAFVENWEPDTFRLFVTDVKGILKTGQFITGAVSNASYNVTSFAVTDLQLNKIQITPTPNTANVTTAFGFDELIQEFPNIV
jgi:T4-like virus Myoviridae tail sheath stabiliser